MRHIYPVGLTACSGDSWRDTVHNIPMMLLCHVCCAGHPYEGLSSLPFWKAIAACEQEEPCKEASVQAPGCSAWRRRAPHSPLHAQVTSPYRVANCCLCVR